MTDFLLKPFDADDLVERIGRLLETPRHERPRRVSSNPILQRGRVLVDAEHREVFANGLKRRVPGMRFELLLCLISRPGFVTAEELLSKLWPDSDFYTVRKNVQRLREDLGFLENSILAANHGYKLVG